LHSQPAAGKQLVEFGGGGAMPKEELLYMPCDVLVPAAIGGVIDKDNAGRLQCKFVAEAANGPTTPEVRL
jgi:glutamate dehydrogenase (NAD(P)+)